MPTKMCKADIAHPIVNGGTGKSRIRNSQTEQPTSEQQNFERGPWRRGAPESKSGNNVVELRASLSSDYGATTDSFLAFAKLLVREHRESRMRVSPSSASVERGFLGRTVTVDAGVGALAADIGMAMGLLNQQIDGLMVCGLLHDIGQIAIPETIFTRRKRLTREERRLLRSHPFIGYDLVKDVTFPWPVGRAILEHHERLDGSGYPRGLRGGDICLEARIIAVADVVEAMTSDRVHRAAPGIEAALMEILSNRARLYDPVVVDSCIRLLDAGDVALPSTSGNPTPAMAMSI